MTPTYRTVFFDLDGTLTDPAAGITRSIQHALTALGYPPPPAEALRSWIGPSLRDSFAALLGDRTLAEEALARYRERYAPIGMFENQVYAGIPALLADLRAAGCRLFLATGKPRPFAERILAHFDLARHFAVIGGATFDGRITEKEEVLAELLPRLSAAERAACVMVGDREHDVLGARHHGIPCIAVGYGFGSPAELAAAAPARVVASVAELREALLSE